MGKKQIPVYLTPEQHEMLKNQADKEGRSMSKQLIHCLFAYEARLARQKITQDQLEARFESGFDGSVSEARLGK